MSEMLAILLGECEEKADWRTWAAGPLAAAPPFQILRSHLDFTQLSQLLPAHHALLLDLYKHKVIGSCAWDEMSGNLQDLAREHWKLTKKVGVSVLANPFQRCNLICELHCVPYQ